MELLEKYYNEFINVNGDLKEFRELTDKEKISISKTTSFSIYKINDLSKQIGNSFLKGIRDFGINTKEFIGNYNKNFKNDERE